MMLPLTKPQVWRRFKRLVMERGFIFAKVTEEFKEQIYFLYMEDFLVKEISVEEFVEDFLDFYREEPHRCVDDLPSMRSTS